MTGRIVHLSDLHFGTERPGLDRALAAEVTRLRPDITVISGDLTQRALVGQYRQVQGFLAALPAPVLCIPGNHDMPLYNLAARIFCPFRVFRRSVARDLEPMLETPRLRVIGMNTADPWVWQRGLVREASLDLACTRLSQALPGQLRVVAMHHPLHQPPETGKAPMAGAALAAQALAEAGADVILCGHLHQWAAAPYALREGGRTMLAVQAGTALSTRLRGEENDFNLIDFDGGRVTVTRFTSPGQSPGFAAAGTTVFSQPDLARGWRAHLPPE